MKKKKNSSDRLPVDALKDGPGVSHLNLSDPALPLYKALKAMRYPLTLRDIMIQPVRTGYIGKDHPIDPKLIPPSGASLFPEIIEKTYDIPSPDGFIRCAVYQSPQAKTDCPIVLYAHGGGFMVGSSQDTDFMTRKIASLNQCLVVSVNYRLAPEFPFPTGLNDFFAVYCWLQNHGEELGGNPRCLIVSGDSSGSNFAAAVPLKAKDENKPLPSAVVLFGPVLDMRFENYPSFNRLAPLGIVYDTAFIGFMRGAYAPQPDLWIHPYATPFLGDLSNYPPTMLIVGTEDPVIDSTRAFAEKLQLSSHAKCLLYVYEGMPHGFYFFPHLFTEEHQAYLDVREFLASLSV